MQKFSKIFEIIKTQAELDFVDVVPGFDTPLYIDPYALTTREDKWSEEAHSLVVSYFQSVFDAVAKKDRKRGIMLLSHLGEPEETHLGVSSEGNKGRGIGEIQATELYKTITRSRAASSGLLEDLYDIPMRNVSSGFYWNADIENWKQRYVELPVYDSKKIILVPKHIVRYRVGVDHSRYRRVFVLDFLQEEHLRAGDSLVTTLRDKKGDISRKLVYKKTVDRHYPTDKDFLAEFSIAHPEILDKYRDDLKLSASKIPNINGENFREENLARTLKSELRKIPKGNAGANSYHELCISILSFLFFPNLINPKKEREINEGRKRIDITYTNGKDSGLFYRVSLDQHLLVNTVHVECKNYTNEIKTQKLIN